MLLGIDEAGRGPVIGPLVLCGVWIAPRNERHLLKLGLRDSKAYGSGETARRQRRELAQLIRSLAARISILVADAAEVDRRVQQGELNVLEQQMAQTVIESGPVARRILVDGYHLFRPLIPRYPQLEAYNRADAEFPIVAAASILAKVERDAQFEAIIAPHVPHVGPIRGGGYVNKGTEAFLKSYVTHFGHLPHHVRRSWSWPVLQKLILRYPSDGMMIPNQLPLWEHET
jgi:ribonuclease HII